MTFKISDFTNLYILFYFIVAIFNEELVFILKDLIEARE